MFVPGLCCVIRVATKKICQTLVQELCGHVIAAHFLRPKTARFWNHTTLLEEPDIAGLM